MADMEQKARRGGAPSEGRGEDNLVHPERPPPL